MISVIIPCQNEGELLAQAVRSVVEQAHRPELDVVIVDDHSEDTRTQQVIDRLVELPEVRATRNERTPGPAGARNTGIHTARGPWIAFLDADDVLLPGSLEKRHWLVQREPNADFVASDFFEVAPDGSRSSWVDRFASNPRVGYAIQRINETRDTTGYVRFDRPVRLLLGAQLVWTGAAMVRTDLVRRLGGFDERLKRGEDTNLWIRLANRAHLWFLPDRLAHYRRRPGSQTLGDTPTQIESREAIRVLLDDPLFRPFRSDIRARLARMNERLTWHYRVHGNRAAAIGTAVQRVRWAPLDMDSWRALGGTLIGR